MRDGSGRYGRVLLLGGTSELGLALLGRLPLQPGCTVVLAGRDGAALESAALPGHVRRQCVRWDAGDPASSRALVAEVLAGGDLDLVVTAAGVLGRAAESDPDLAHQVLTVNLLGLVDALVPLGEAMRQQQHGTIVVFSSIAGVRARRSNYLYGASKAGLDAFASGLGDRLAADGVQVVVVRPGFVRGRMTAGMPAAPLATTPDAVAAAVVTGLQRGRLVIWAPAALGLLAPVLRALPRRLWRRLEI